MLSKFLTSLGLTRDSKLWPSARWLALATMVASGTVDVVGLGAWLGIHVTPVMAHWMTAIAVIVLWWAGKYDTSPLPGGTDKQDLGSVTPPKLPVVLLAIALTASLALPGCSSFKAPSSVTTPQGKAAYTADQVVQRLGELQAAAIQANQQGALADKSAVLVVQFTVGATKTAMQTPAGWQASVVTGYQALKSTLPPADLQKLSVAFATVDALLATLGGGQ